MIDETGNVYGRLTVLAEAPRQPQRPSLRAWFCRCECGTEISVIGNNLRRGATLSCGCLNSELSRKRRTTHGRYVTRRGVDRTFYGTWTLMLSRCLEPGDSDWASYGGRGITVCPEWQGVDGLEAFTRDMGPKPTPSHSVDRIDVDGNYEPTNCRWATVLEQAHNKRPRIFRKGSA